MNCVAVRVSIAEGDDYSDSAAQTCLCQAESQRLIAVRKDQFVEQELVQVFGIYIAKGKRIESNEESA
jgi:hypothetical protein